MRRLDISSEKLQVSYKSFARYIPSFSVPFFLTWNGNLSKEVHDTTDQ
jgi:hypothetical protein